MVKKRSERTKGLNLQYILVITAGVAINVLLANLMGLFGTPLFLDTFGTIAVSTVLGLFPGILVAVLTNVICAFFDGSAVYFGFINASIAIFAATFARNNGFKSMGRTAGFAAFVGIYSGALGAFVDWYLFQGALVDQIHETADTLSASTGIPPFLAFMIVNILMNMLDKAIVCASVMIFIMYSPKALFEKAGRLSWKQRPISNSEIKSLREWAKSVRFSMRLRTALTLVITSLVLVLATGVTSASIYFKNLNEEKTWNTEYAAKFAASVIDADMVDAYLESDQDLPGYAETKELLVGIRDSISDISTISVLKFEEDGMYYVFDLDSFYFGEGAKAGTKEEFYGGMQEIFENNNSEDGIVHMTFNYGDSTSLNVYVPVRNAAGDTVCYAMAASSISYFSDFIKNYVVKSILILAGFFMLIVAFGLWISDVNMVFPVSAMAQCVEGFSTADDSQENIDADVKKLRSLDIRTGDEVEKLYHSLCDLTLNQAEQIRSIRRLLESTSKMQEGLIITMADMVENRDSDTGAHVQKTAAYVKIIVEGLKKKGYYAGKVTDKFVSDVVRSAPLHDVGKINISDEILNKPGSLSKEEFEIMKTHTTLGRQIIENAITKAEGESYLKEARNMAAYHHERWDGKGYPEGLHGEVIPLSARIMAVADVFDALTSPRVYKPAFPFEKAIAIIEDGKGTQFDPKCVEAFMDGLPEVRVILAKYKQR